MYYIYEKSSTYIIGKPDSKGVARPDHRQSYKTMAAAKAGLTRIKKANSKTKTKTITQTTTKAMTKTDSCRSCGSCPPMNSASRI